MKKFAKVVNIFQARSPCDAQNQTQTIYRWLDPKICVSGVRLPPPGPKHPCLPCNPGMSQAAGGASCEFCPLNHISEAGGDCKKCPPNTTPNYGYIMERWAEMPPMVSSACRLQDGERDKFPIKVTRNLVVKKVRKFQLFPKVKKNSCLMTFKLFNSRM
jgi:hypothetical protein